MEGFVYFIQQGDDGPVKIGWSGTRAGVEKRLVGLQTGNPEKLAIRNVIPGSQWDETNLHRRFEKWRMEGEWFMATVEIAQFARCPDMKARNPLRRSLPLLERAYDAGYRAGADEIEDLLTEQMRRLDETVAGLRDATEDLEELRRRGQLASRGVVQMDALRKAVGGSQEGHTPPESSPETAVARLDSAA